MSRRLLALNLLLLAAAVVFSIQMVRISSTARQLPPPASPSPQRASAPPSKDTPVRDESRPSRPSPATNEQIAARNLFNPNRSPEAVTASPTPLAPAVKPVLYGVVIDGGTRLAYLEDPSTKRVFGFKTGDAVAGGRVEQIEEDRVVIKRPEGPLEIRLQDPSKPKPAVPATPRVLAPPTPPAPGVLPPGVRPPLQPGIIRPLRPQRMDGGGGPPGSPSPDR